METNGYPAATAADDAIDLAAFQDEFRDAQPEKSEFEPVPDGKFQAVVDRVELARSKTNGTPMLKWTLRILGPTSEGRLLWRYNLIAAGNNMKWLKTDLFTCGLELANITDLAANLERLLDVKLEITKKTHGEFENVYFNRRITLDESPAARPSGTPF